MKQYWRAGWNSCQRGRPRGTAARHTLMMTLRRRGLAGMTVMLVYLHHMVLARLAHRIMPTGHSHGPHMGSHQRHRAQMQQDGEGRYPDGSTTRALHMASGSSGREWRRTQSPTPVHYLAVPLALRRVAGCLSCPTSARRVIQVGAWSLACSWSRTQRSTPASTSRGARSALSSR